MPVSLLLISRSFSFSLTCIAMQRGSTLLVPDMHEDWEERVFFFCSCEKSVYVSDLVDGFCRDYVHVRVAGTERKESASAIAMDTANSILTHCTRCESEQKVSEEANRLSLSPA